MHCREKLLRYKRLCSSFQLEHGREPSEREIACLMGLTLEQIREIKGNACMARVGSLDAPMKGLEEDGVTVGDVVASGDNLEGAALDRVQSAQLCAVLWECVDSLQGQQPAVIRQRYQGGMSLREIGEAQGTTAEAVRQIHAKALRELRASRFSKRLRPFLPEAEQIYSLGLRGNGVGKFNRTWTSSTWSCWRECGRPLRYRNRRRLCSGTKMELQKSAGIAKRTYFRKDHRENSVKQCLQ